MARGRPARCSLRPLLAVRSSKPNKELLASMALFSSMYCSWRHSYYRNRNLRAAWHKVLHDTNADFQARNAILPQGKVHDAFDSWPKSIQHVALRINQRKKQGYRQQTKHGSRP